MINLNTMLTPRRDLPFIRQWAEKNPPFLTGKFQGRRLFTALQPIYSLAHKRVVGHEALVRVRDRNNSSIPPFLLFDQEKSAADMIHLDRLCRYLHVHNYKLLGDSLNWLFLNVSPMTITSGKAYGSYFKELLGEFEFPAHRVVIKVVEHPIEDNDLLMDTIAYYKELGCLIALDDFGAGNSNFDRIWTLRPDIVKLDRTFMTRAMFHPDQLQVTRPYLSITGAHMCMTLSMKFACPSGESVLCCDLKV